MKTLEHKQHSLRLNSCTIPVELGTKSGLLNSNTCEVYTKKITILSSFLKKLQPNLDQREIFHVSVETLGQTIVETPLRRKDSVNWINGKRSSRNLCHCSVYQRWFEIALLSKVVQSQGVACRQKIRAVKQFFQGQWLCKGANCSGFTGFFRKKHRGNNLFLAERFLTVPVQGSNFAISRSLALILSSRMEIEKNFILNV